MKTAFCRSRIVITCLSGCFIWLVLQASGSPAVPIEWQQRVKSGLLEAQSKHVAWSRDQNNNFVDDAIEAMNPIARITMIIQLNSCEGESAIAQFLSSYGTIRRIGTLVPYVILDNVRAGDAVYIATNSLVAAVEADRVVHAVDDTSGRAVRARTSVTFSPETFADKTASNGGGINVAIVDTGVDDAGHLAFAGKFVAGYNATTATPGNPPDDAAETPQIVTGANGICNTTASGDDLQGDLETPGLVSVPVGKGYPDPFPFAGYAFPAPGIQPGKDGTIHSTPGGDDVLTVNPFDGVTPYIAVGPDGICNTTADPRDIQVVPVGKGTPGRPCISPGPNGVIDTVPSPDDTVSPGGWHGTHVAGIVMGLGVGSGCRPANDGSLPNDCAGLAPGAGLVDVKVLDSTGSGFISQIIDGLEWIWMHSNARVVNISIGDNTPADGTDTISQVIDLLVLNGISVVVAAGNSGGATLGSIASSDLALTVAASDDRGTVDRNDDVIAPFSTIGPRVDFTGANVLDGQLKPDITAPGVNIISAQGGGSGGYHALSGTSMASPCVAGAAALLLSYSPNLPPGCLKDLLKRSAYVTPQHMALGPASFPAVDSTYNIHWGFGLLDLYTAWQNLSAGIADITFPSCLPGAAGDSCGLPCNLSGGVPSYQNDADILVAANPPVSGVPTVVTIKVQNRTSSAAQNVEVCVGVLEFNAGNVQVGAYNVGCQTVNVPALATVDVNFNWTPVAVYQHQCIVATINYGFDKDFCNNMTQKNIDTVSTHSTQTATFKVVNPFKETTTIVLTPQLTNDLFRAVLMPTNVFTLEPGDCPPVAQMAFTPQPGTPIGTTARFSVPARGFNASHPNGIDLPGVAFSVTQVAGGIARAYSVGRHGDQGLINLPLNLAGTPTSDPRAIVNELLVDFDIPVRPTNGVLNAGQVIITGSPSNSVPPYTVSFTGGGNVGQELTILFSQPLMDQQRYTVSFAKFTGSDGSPLLGDLDFDLRVLQGDANGSGAVTATDVSFVRGKVGQVAAYGDSSRADLNMTGAVTATDISFVRSRIGNSAP